MKSADWAFVSPSRLPPAARAWALAALLLNAWPAAAQTPSEPSAQNPAPPGAGVPTAPPIDPAAPPPAREPAAPAPPAPADVPPPPGEPQPSPPAEEPAAPESATSGVPAAEPAAAPTAADPGSGPLVGSAVSEFPELVVPPLEAFGHQLAAYRAAAQGQLETALHHYELALRGEPDNLRWGTQYRQVVIAAKKYERGIRFLENLAKRHPDAANLHMNLGYAYVDKVPVEGAITQVILAGNALREFGKALELEKTWLGYYTRGSSYVYWPPIFNRTLLGIADLEEAIALAKKEPKRPYHARAWAALGDGFWRLGKRDTMRETWRKGLELYPGDPDLQERLDKPDAELDTFLLSYYELGRRVDTRLEEIWQALRAEVP